MPSFNDLLVIVIIPLMDTIIFPLFFYCFKFRVRALHKIGAGMMCGALSFVLAGVVELFINSEADKGKLVSVWWELPQVGTVLCLIIER